MPFEVYEAYNSRIVSRTWTRVTAKTRWFGFYSFDEDEVETAFGLAIPSTFTDPVTSTVLLVQDYTPDHIGGGYWTAEVSYESTVTEVQAGQGGASPPPPPPPLPGPTDPLGPEYSINIGNRTEKVFQSKETVDEGGPALVPDTHQSIGLTADGEIQGVDRIAPTMEFTITKVFNYITMAYVGDLFNLVGKTNNGTWFGFLEGELLFKGATIQSRDINKVNVTFTIEASPNLVDIPVSSAITIPFKKGWEYVWFGYKTVESNGYVAQEPYYYKIEQIYDSEDFGLMGIGS